MSQTTSSRLISLGLFLAACFGCLASGGPVAAAPAGGKHTTPMQLPPVAPVPVPVPEPTPEPMAQAEACYELGTAARRFPRTPTVLCVAHASDAAYRLTLRQGLSAGQPAPSAGSPPTTLATFEYTLLERVRCIDCNKDVFGFAADDEVTSKLKIRFDGMTDPKTKIESGRVWMGATQFFYRKMK